MVGNPFGMIKKQWDFYFIMTKKSMKHASADVGLIFTAFNLRRIFNLVDHNLLKKYFKVLAPFLWLVRAYFKPISAFVFRLKCCLELKTYCFLMLLNQLYLTPKNANLKINLGF